MEIRPGLQGYLQDREVVVAGKDTETGVGYVPGRYGSIPGSRNAVLTGCLFSRKNSVNSSLYLVLATTTDTIR